MTESSLGVFGV